MTKQQPDQGKPQQPTMIGGYELISKLGQGAVGTVYKARQTNVGRIVALKVLDPKYSRDRKYVARFLREARSAGNLNHVNIVQGIDAGKSPEGFYYFAMEFVEGETIKKMLQRNGVIPEEQATSIVAQVAQALRHAAKIKLVHRDIKPENIILTKDGVAKLADLGLAKTVVDDVSVTQSGQAMGTPLYISPEQAIGQDVDVRADIYSLGITFYHMVTGYTPFTGENASRVIARHIHDQAPSPREFNQKLSPDVCNVIMKMIAKDPSERYQDPTALIDDLAALAARRQPPIATDYAKRSVMRAILPAQPPRRRRGIQPASVLIAIGFLTLAGAVFAYFVLLKPPGEQVAANVEPAPPPKIEPPVESPAEREAKARFAQAQAFEDKNLLKEARQACEDVTRQYPKSSVAVAAAEKIARIDRKLADQAFAELKKEVDAALKESYGKAVDIILKRQETVKLLPREQTEALLDKLRTEYKGLAESLRQQAADLFREGKFEEARRVYRQFRTIGMENYNKEADEGVAKIDAELKALKEEAAQTHAKFWLHFAVTVREKGPADADTLARKALTAPEFSKAKVEIEWDRALLGYLPEIDAQARAGLASLAGKSFVLRGRKPVRVTKVEGDADRFYIERDGVRDPRPILFSSLSADERFRLAEHNWGKQDRPQHRAAFRLFYATEQEELVAARQAIDGSALPNDEKERFAVRMEALNPELGAIKLFNEAAAAMKAGKWQEAEQKYAKLAADHPNSWTFTHNAGDIADQRSRAARTVLAAAAPKKFHGKVELVRDRWCFKWDFSDPEQLKDFDFAPMPGDAAAAGKAKPPMVYDGYLALRGQDVVVRPIFRGAPISIEYRIKVVTDDAARGQGRAIILNRKAETLWEFAWCHGSRKAREPDYFRNIRSLGQTDKNCWKWLTPPKERNRWFPVKCEITKAAAKVDLDRLNVYDSATVLTPEGKPDANALPDLSEFYQVQFGGAPEDAWGFDDITITGPIDDAWMKTFLEKE